MKRRPHKTDLLATFVVGCWGGQWALGWQQPFPYKGWSSWVLLIGGFIICALAFAAWLDWRDRKMRGE